MDEDAELDIDCDGEMDGEGELDIDCEGEREGDGELDTELEGETELDGEFGLKSHPLPAVTTAWLSVLLAPAYHVEAGVATECWMLSQSAEMVPLPVATRA